MYNHINNKNMFVIGCGRWGSFVAWYLNRTGHNVTLYGRIDSKNMKQLKEFRKNEYITLPKELNLTCELERITNAEIVFISVNSQNLNELMKDIGKYDIKNKIIVLCMKGIYIKTGERLSQIVEKNIDKSNKVAVWLGPGHIQDFYNSKPNCMVIDSDNINVRNYLVDILSSDLIRFYYGTDLVGNEIGAALKNVVGIAAGMLDGLEMSSLKGSLMSRGTIEVGRLIERMGGKTETAYGLCHLGDYEATLFSLHSHNRLYGEKFVRGQHLDKLAEGYYTVQAVVSIKNRLGIDMPICEAVYEVLFNNAEPLSMIDKLFARQQKNEF